MLFFSLVGTFDQSASLEGELIQLAASFGY